MTAHHVGNTWFTGWQATSTHTTIMIHTDMVTKNLSGPSSIAGGPQKHFEEKKTKTNYVVI